MVCVGFVVERRDLDEAGGPVEADRFDEGLVGLEPDSPGATLGGELLELAQEAAAAAGAAGGLDNPHPLDIRGLAAVELESPAADRLRSQRCHEEQAGRGPQLRPEGGGAG